MRKEHLWISSDKVPYCPILTTKEGTVTSLRDAEASSR